MTEGLQRVDAAAERAPERDAPRVVKGSESERNLAWTLDLVEAYFAARETERHCA